MAYFAIFPDYKIEINEIIEKDSLICTPGYASGQYRNRQNKNNINYWRILTVWKTITSANKIEQWQIYADNLIVTNNNKK